MYALEVVIADLPTEVQEALKPNLGRTSIDKTKGAIRYSIALKAYPDVDIEALPKTDLATKEDYELLLASAVYQGADKLN